MSSKMNSNWNNVRVRWGNNGYECSSKGDHRFSALYAKMPDGRTIEMWYQCDIKGYNIGGRNWRLGKGKPPLINWDRDQLASLYLNLWKFWAIHNSGLVIELAEIAREKHDGVLSDCFAHGNHINQANALAEIINDWKL